MEQYFPPFHCFIKNISPLRYTLPLSFIYCFTFIYPLFSNIYTKVGNLLSRSVRDPSDWIKYVRNNTHRGRAHKLFRLVHSLQTFVIVCPDFAAVHKMTEKIIFRGLGAQHLQVDEKSTEIRGIVFVWQGLKKGSNIEAKGKEGERRDRGEKKDIWCHR